MSGCLNPETEFRMSRLNKRIAKMFDLRTIRINVESIAHRTRGRLNETFSYFVVIDWIYLVLEDTLYHYKYSVDTPSSYFFLQKTLQILNNTANTLLKIKVIIRFFTAMP